MSEVQSGLKSGRLFQGSFQASRENYLEAVQKLEDALYAVPA